MAGAVFCTSNEFIAVTASLLYGVSSVSEA